MTKPKRRNASLVLVGPMLPVVLVLMVESWAGPILFPYAVLVAILVGIVLGFVTLAAMTRELRSVTGNQDFSWWPVLIPFYGFYWSTVVLQAEVAKAKAMRGAPEARDSFVYLCCPWGALAQDLNDLALTHPTPPDPRPDSTSPP